MLLISGSFALQFFDRVCWPASDLDINIRQGLGTLESYLCRVEGYTLQRSTDGHKYNMIGIDKVLFLHCEFCAGIGLGTIAGSTFFRTQVILIEYTEIRTLVRRQANAPETQIQICISHGLPVEQILTGFYSTHVVNLIS